MTTTSSPGFAATEVSALTNSANRDSGLLKLCKTLAAWCATRGASSRSREQTPKSLLCCVCQGGNTNARHSWCNCIHERVRSNQGAARLKQSPKLRIAAFIFDTSWRMPLHPSQAGRSFPRPVQELARWRTGWNQGKSSYY